MKLTAKAPENGWLLEGDDPFPYLFGRGEVPGPLRAFWSSGGMISGEEKWPPRHLTQNCRTPKGSEKGNMLQSSSYC